MDLSQFLTIASWAATISGIWKLFSYAEEVASPPTKKAIADWLLNLEAKGGFSNWLAAFGSVFDRVFGERHFSWRCFGRSCLASLVTVSILILIWMGRSFDELMTDDTWRQAGLPRLFIVMVSFYVICNFIPDYFSLLKTRRIISVLSTPGSTFRVITWVALDAIGSVAIALAALAMFISALVLLQDGASGFSLVYIRVKIMVVWFLSVFIYISEELRLSGVKGLFGVFVYSTFFTSFWVWLYVISGLVIKLNNYLGWGLSRIKSIFDIREKPLRSLGAVSCLAVTVLYILVAFFKRIT